MSKRDPSQITTVRRNRRIIRIVTITKKITTAGPIYLAFGYAVRDLRKNAGMTQADLAEKVSLVRGSIANIETGRQRVMLGDLFIFAKALKVPASRLFAKLPND